MKTNQKEEIRTHALRIRVKLDADWQKAITAAGPQTPDNYNVRKVGDQYLPTGTGEVEEDYILLNFPKGDGSWDKALAWAKANGHENTVPREAFAVGEKFPQLHRELNVNPMYVVATTECSFGGYRNACYVWWSGAEREANLSWLEGFDDASGWFLFRKSALTPSDTQISLGRSALCPHCNESITLSK